MRTIYILLLLALFPLIVKAQITITAAPVLGNSTNVKSLGMGNANVSLRGTLVDKHLNIAGSGVDSSFTVSFYHDRLPFRNDPTITHIGGIFVIKKSTFSYSGRYFDLGKTFQTEENSTQVIEEFNPYEFFLNLGYSYSFENGFNLGVGVNYIRSNLGPAGSINEEEYEARSVAIDVGMQYQRVIYSNEKIELLPSAGVSLSDFGALLKYQKDKPADPLPMKLRAGSAISLKIKNEHLELNPLELTLSGSLSKTMVRRKIENIDGQPTFVSMRPLEALFNSWDEYVIFNGQEYQYISVSEQFGRHIGFEVKFLETFSFRVGGENLGKANNSIGFQSVGIGIDLYYLTIDWAKLDYNEGYSYSEDQQYWQLTGRIPLNGKTPNTILSQLFK